MPVLLLHDVRMPCRIDCHSQPLRSVQSGELFANRQQDPATAGPAPSDAGRSSAYPGASHDSRSIASRQQSPKPCYRKSGALWCCLSFGTSRCSTTCAGHVAKCVNHLGFRPIPGCLTLRWISGICRGMRQHVRRYACAGKVILGSRESRV